MGAPQPTTIRTSSLTRFCDCPRRWAAGAIAKEIKAAGYVVRDEVRGIAPALGSSVHKSAELMLREKSAKGKLPPVSVAMDIAVDAVKEEIALGISYDTQYTLNAPDAHKQAAQAAGAYHAHIAPQIKPLMIEQRLEATIPWAVESLVLSGQPDIVAQEPDKLRDLKFSVRYGNHNAQGGGYMLLLRSNGMEHIKEASIDWMPRVRSSKPQPTPQERSIPISIAEQSATNILRHIDADLHVWRHGDEKRGLLPGDSAAFLSNPQSMICSPRYCKCHSAGPNGFCLDYEKGDE